MDAISYTNAREKLAETMNRVCQDSAPIIITRQKAPAVVMMSLADYNAIEETAYLLRSPANAVRLRKGIADVEASKTTLHDLIED